LAALCRIVLTQAHHHPEAKEYIERRVSQGKTKREAHRALRRFVVRAIWRLWQEWQEVRATSVGFAA
jgi:transposase